MDGAAHGKRAVLVIGSFKLFDGIENEIIARIRDFVCSSST